MDPISNMLIMIKNATRAKKEAVFLPFSNLKETIANCLLKQGFISSVEKKIQKGKPMLQIGLKYENGLSKITDLKRVSKSSCRVYIGRQDIKPVKQGYGLLVLSTPKGILTGDQARKELIGGEALFEIW